MGAPNVMVEDHYHLWVPIEDTELMKSIEVDENGDYIVQGVMTSEDKDEEDDSITPDGMDCSYFLTKGWIKYEHGNNPNQFIGEPIEVRVGRFDHPTLQKSVNGIFVKGRLFARRKLAQEAVQAMQDLQKSHTKRRMGWSIEGNVKERCHKTGKILKSVLRNVVLTMNPVNPTTWAELAKSFAKNHEVEVDMDVDMDVEKSMDTDAIAEVTPQSIEGYDPEEDPQEKWVKAFREFVKRNALQKSLRTKFVTRTGGEVGLDAYMFATQNGLDYHEACEFAGYIADKHDILKSLIGRIGGETMSKAQKYTIASLLDADLEELQKSLDVTDEDDEEMENGEEENEDLEKSNGGEGDNGGSENGEEDDDEDVDDEDVDDEDDEDSEDGEEDEDMEKSIHSDLHKSLSEDHGQAFEVSDWLSALVDELGFGMEGIQKSMTHMTKQQGVITKSLMTAVQVIQDLSQRVEGQDATIETLQKSLNDVLERPIGRKSVVNQREVHTLTKSMGYEGGRELTKTEIGEILQKSFEAGELNGSEVVRYESGVPLDKLNLTPQVKSKLGLA